MSIAADSYGIVYFNYNHPRITARFHKNIKKLIWLQKYIDFCKPPKELITKFCRQRKILYFCARL